MVPKEKRKAEENLRGDKNLTRKIYDRIKEMMLNYDNAVSKGEVLRETDRFEGQKDSWWAVY